MKQSVAIQRFKIAEEELFSVSDLRTLSENN